MRKKNNTWWKIVAVIVILELVVGGVIFAYKKLKDKPDNELSIKDKTVQDLYQKIAYEDIDILDIMSKEAMLYYGYHNVSQKQTINCEVVKVDTDTSSYQCDGMTPFIPEEDLVSAVKDLYGPTIEVELTDFAIDQNHYGFVDKENKGIVLFTKKKEVSVDPVNLHLEKAEKLDNQLILTTEVLDGIYGTLKATYKYTFEKSGKDYYLIKKEKVSL